MRKTKVFGGSSHPELTSLITGRLGVEPGAVKLSQFKNKETSVEIGNVSFSHFSLNINWSLQVECVGRKNGGARRTEYDSPGDVFVFIFL